MANVGIFGGTFDPIHYGHLFLAEEAREVYSLDRVVFVPNGQPALDKGRLVSSPQARLEMTACAIQANPWFNTSRTEIDRPGPSFTIDTIHKFRSESADNIFFITGADAMLEIKQWRRSEELLDSCRFIAGLRPGYDLDRWYEQVDYDIAAKVDILPIPLIEISSTEIRRRVYTERSIQYLTPDSVVIYISDHHLYRNNH